MSDKAWNESKHARAHDGRFGRKAGNWGTPQQSAHGPDAWPGAGATASTPLPSQPLTASQREGIARQVGIMVILAVCGGEIRPLVDGH